MLTPEQIDNMRIVMVRTRNPLNVGAVARAMSNFGFLNLRMVQPYDAAFREARSAVDAEQVLAAAVEFEDVARAVADCSLVVGTTGGGARHTLEPIQRLETAAKMIRHHLQSGEKVAMLFGSEKVGLSNDDLNHCQILLRIPTRTEHLSMNLGQAVAITLYELVRDPAETFTRTQSPTRDYGRTGAVPRTAVACAFTQQLCSTRNGTRDGAEASEIAPACSGYAARSAGVARSYPADCVEAGFPPPGAIAPK